MHLARSVALRCCCAARPRQDEVAWFIAQGCIPGVCHGSSVGRRARVVARKAATMAAVAACTPTIASVHAGSTGPLGMYLVIPVRALCSVESLILTSGRHVRHTRCTARGKCVHLHVQHLHTPRAARRAQLFDLYMYPDVFRAGTLAVLYHDREIHISAERVTPFRLTVRWAKAIKY